ASIVTGFELAGGPSAMDDVGRDFRPQPEDGLILGAGLIETARLGMGTRYAQMRVSHLGTEPAIARVGPLSGPQQFARLGIIFLPFQQVAESLERWPVIRKAL